MIKRLRRKFVLVVMALITLVLCIVFAAICASTAEREVGQSERALQSVLDFAREGKPPLRFQIMERATQRGLPPDDVTRAVFTVTVDENGDMTDYNAMNVDVTEEIAKDAAALALADGGDRGVIAKYALRYQKGAGKSGDTLAFISTESETAAVRALAATLALMGAGGLALFFIISVFLANWALRPVEQAWTRQRQFIADASHELKTPLTVILANLGILKDERWNTWLESTEAEAVRMRGLVDELLFLARSDEALTLPEKTPVNLSDTVWKCLLPFEAVAFERGVTLESEIAPDVTVSGDGEQLQRLVSILLDNACKYAGDGGAVTVALEQVGAGARLCVKNTGAPIAPEHLSHIFDRFYRADPARTEGGTGLGLAIAKSIAEMHGGQITARSEQTLGTIFTVTL